MISTSETADTSMSGNSNNLSSPGPSMARCASSEPDVVRTKTVTGAVSSVQWVTTMPAPNGSLPHASATGHGGSPSAFGGNTAGATAGAPIAAAAGAATGA